MADTVYGNRIKVTPATANSFKTVSVLSSAETPTGTKTELARQAGTAVWWYDDTRPLSAGRAYYFVHWEQTGYTPTDFGGPVDAEPTDLQVET